MTTSQLDAALKDLEDRGLLWWERASNLYDMHPIIRAYVHSQLEREERVQANLYAHDYFAALPPENTDAATSVDELGQTIAIYRALIGGERFEEAYLVWTNRLSVPLSTFIGASATALELLSPLTKRPKKWHLRRHPTVKDIGIRNDLVQAHSDLLQFDEAICEQVENLRSAMLAGDYQQLALGLSRLSSLYGMIGAELHSERCLDLQSALHDTLNWSTDANYHLKWGVRSAVRGHTDNASTHFDEALAHGMPSTNPWLRVEVFRWQTYMADRNWDSVNFEELDAIRTSQDLPGSLYSLTKLECDLALRHGEHALALQLAEKCEPRPRNQIGIQSISSEQHWHWHCCGSPTTKREWLSPVADRSHQSLAADAGYCLAHTLPALGRRSEAEQHTLSAYKQAWRDGYPYCHYWDLRQCSAPTKAFRPAPATSQGIPITGENSAKGLYARQLSRRASEEITWAWLARL